MNPEQEVTWERSGDILKSILTFDKLIAPRFICQGFTPRSIEVPWAASHLQGKVLDIGFSFSPPQYMRTILTADLTGTDIIKPEDVKGRFEADYLEEILAVPFIHGDIRTVELPKDTFDTVTCISTIEHIGYDKPASTVEGGAYERPRTKEAVNTVREPVHEQFLNNIHSTLKVGGRLLISTPMGSGGPLFDTDSLGFHVVENEYNAESWAELTKDPRFKIVEEYFFLNTVNGWTIVPSPRWLNDVHGDYNEQGVGFALCVLEKL